MYKCYHYQYRKQWIPFILRQKRTGQTMLENKTPEQLKQEFQFTLSKVSHEIRNPVTLINSYLQFIEKAHPEVEEFEYWDDIMDQMDFLKKLLEDLSFYNNSAKLRREPVHISPFLAKLTDRLKPAYAYLGIRLIYEDCIRDADVVLSLDTVKIQQALLNLMRNACEAIEDAGEIHLLLKEDGPALCIQITDTGCGIDPEHLPTLFDPFITHKEYGSGLGLAIVRQVIRAHGGDITVSSCPGKGSTFTLTLPRT